MTDPDQKPSSPALSAAIVLGMLMMVVVPAAITLRSVRSPATLVATSSNPSPYGYTWSLLLFVVPILIIMLWFLPSEGLQIPQRAFWRTILILVPLGWMLDFLFAQYFFCYPNPQATLGIHAWALGRPVPVEEYVFYMTGFIAVLLLYVWLGEYWLAAYSVSDYPGEARKIIRLLRFHPTSLIVGGVLVGAAWFYKEALGSYGCARWIPRVFHFSRDWGAGALDQLFSDCSTLYQLESVQPDSVLYAVDQSAVGSHARFAVWLVELSASADDWVVYWGMERSSH